VRASIFVSALLAAVMLSGMAPASASSVTFANKNGVKNVNADISGATVEFRVANIENDSKRSTGTLRLELWAASRPFVSDANSAPPMDYKLAQFQLGVLRGMIPSGDPSMPPFIDKYTNLISPPLPLGVPPDGTWYYVVFLTEFTGAATDDGFSVDDWVVMPATVTVGTSSPPPDLIGRAVEYLYADWGFYFVTAFPSEIDALDNGAFGRAWVRTGETFHVWRSPVAASAATCRFFSAVFAPKSTHFYTPFQAECNALKANPAWVDEGIAFYVALPDADGLCAVGTVPLYRAYNNGIGGAPNHRYTTTFATLQQMLAAGWTFEGNGNTEIFACVPQ
jgi:hypothetical protein